MVIIDADGCPVVELTIRICRKHNVQCRIFCDTAHEFHFDGIETITVDKGADSADFAIANQAGIGDLVVTQDYGLASMCLAKGARVLHQDGWEYTQWNIGSLLLQRHESRKYRLSGGRQKGPKKRCRQQDDAFQQLLDCLLSDIQN